MAGWTQAMVTQRELATQAVERKTRLNVAGRRPDLKNQFFRSKMEANIARYLNWMQNIGAVTKWEYETETYWFNAETAATAREWWMKNRGIRKNFKGVLRGVCSYKIDFKVWFSRGPDPVLWECKGWMDSKSKTKLRRMEEYFPWMEMRVIGGKEYKQIARQAKGAIKEWE